MNHGRALHGHAIWTLFTCSLPWHEFVQLNCCLCRAREVLCPCAPHLPISQSVRSVAHASLLCMARRAAGLCHSRPGLLLRAQPLLQVKPPCKLQGSRAHMGPHTPVFYQPACTNQVSVCSSHRAAVGRWGPTRWRALVPQPPPVGASWGSSLCSEQSSYFYGASRSLLGVVLSPPGETLHNCCALQSDYN